MKVDQIAKLINKVCGLSQNWAKTCIYYCMATHHLSIINWMPVLSIVAQKGSGKSQLIRVLKQLCHKPYPISCHSRMTGTALRNELHKAVDSTAVIEEGDLFPRRSTLEGFLISRVSRSTAELPVTQQKEIKSGMVWNAAKINIFGATILHDRHEFNDLATERRTIIVPIKRQRGNTFFKPDDAFLKGVSLPSFSYGNIPVIFQAPEIEDAPKDTWEPLIRIAESLCDDEWLPWAWDKVTEMGDKLADGQQYELETVAFKGVINGFNDKAGMLVVKEPLSLSAVTNFIKKEYDPFIHPKTVATKLRSMGLKNIRNVGGDTKIFTTLDELKKIAQDINYQDDQL